MSLLTERATYCAGVIPKTLQVTFRCPSCPKSHQFYVHRDVPQPGIWQATWDDAEPLQTLTVSPSLDFGCWHGHIENGEIKP